MLDLAATAIDFMINLRGGAATVLIRRHYRTGGTGVYDPDTGLWNEASPEWIPPDGSTIQAFIAAISPHDIQNLPEGVRAEARWTVWTRDDLTATDETRGLVGDEIFWADAWWGVIQIWPRREAGYTKAVLGLIERASPDD